jgi:hypothetical protein
MSGTADIGAFPMGNFSDAGKPAVDQNRSISSAPANVQSRRKLPIMHLTGFVLGRDPFAFTFRTSTV